MEDKQKNEILKLKEVIKSLQSQLKYERRNREARENRADELRNTFKELLIEVLGK